MLTSMVRKYSPQRLRYLKQCAIRKANLLKLKSTYMVNDSNLKIGLFAVGLDSYWDQFEGLKDRIDNQLQGVDRKLKSMHPGIVNAGMVDHIDKAFAAGK